MGDKTPFYITTAISYPNGAPHIGHAYEAVATDALARFHRLDGRDVFFLTGTDEHGLKMQQTALKEGVPVTELAKRNSDRFEDMVKLLNCSNDDFIRTSEPRHKAASQEIWRRMAEAGDIYSDKYAGWYSVRDEAFYDESETVKTESGERIGPQGTPVEWTEEETYFFKLSAYQDRLLKLYNEQEDFISPATKRNEVLRFVEGGLRDLSISRTTFDWGIEVPGDEGHIMYVWVDALTNYLTGVGFPDEESESFKKYWPCDAHIIGKDILRFHSVYWPAFLLSAGIELPKRIFAHGFLLSQGEKMAKSLGNVVSPDDMVALYGVDQVRYFFLREVPFGNDGNYSHEVIVNRINADLANDLGNLASRSLSMIVKNLDGVLQEPGEYTAEDKAILALADGALAEARTAMEDIQPNKAADAVWQVVGEANKYFAAAEPWALKKTDPARMATVLYVTAEVIRQVAILAQPFVPEGAGVLLDMLQQDDNKRDFASLGETGRLQAGLVFEKPSPVFPRFVEEEGEA
ncbi:MAG: methionine--tRNA ligase [Rhodomicrobium sp.]|nr:MAG: methionine--tRNA ligase [Rhodomicrobium sp.]